jgi:hypothetical protein
MGSMIDTPAVLAVGCRAGLSFALLACSQALLPCCCCTQVIKVRERKGFVRIAVETGTPIVPVYHFGNSLLFRWVAPRALERWARRLRVAAGYTCGRWLTPLPNK